MLRTTSMQVVAGTRSHSAGDSRAVASAVPSSELPTMDSAASPKVSTSPSSMNGRFGKIEALSLPLQRTALPQRQPRTPPRRPAAGRQVEHEGLEQADHHEDGDDSREGL